MLDILARASRHIAHTQGQGSLMLSTPNKINNDIKGVLLERQRRTTSPPARVPARPPGQVGPMESTLYEYRLHRQHFP